MSVRPVMLKVIHCVQWEQHYKSQHLMCNAMKLYKCTDGASLSVCLAKASCRSAVQSTPVDREDSGCSA